MSDTATTTTSSGATGGATTTATTAAPPPAATSDWTTGLSDDQKGYVQNKGFKDPAAVVDSYRNFEKMYGVPKERLITLPEKLEGADAAAVFQRLGMPKEAKDYNVKIPKEMGDEKVADKIKEFAFKNHMTNRQVEALVQQEVDDWTAKTKQETETQEINLKNAQDNLKKEWGQAYDQNKNMADQGAIAIGMNQDQVKALGAALGPDGAMKLLHKIASATGESSFVTGINTGGGINSPEGAINKINELMRDKGFGARLDNNDADAKALWDRLHREAYPG